MMGLGYLGSSSSSSSSNLSPLAPPFTVDRSNHNKPVLNSNSISHLNDSSYGVPFSSSWPYSHSSSSARQNLLADSTTLPLHDSGYMIPEPVNHPTAGNWSALNTNGKHGSEQITPHWSAVYPSPKRVTDSFAYNLSEAKPFYPPYASSVNNINDDIPLVTFSEPSYDLLSTSGLGQGRGQGQGDEVDYTRSLSGLEYNLNHPQQDGVWSRQPLPLPEGVKKIETDDSFFSEEPNLAAASLAYNNYLHQGAYGAESSSKSKDDSSSLFYYADIIRRANDTGPSSNGSASSSAKGGSAFRAFPMFSESHPLIQPPEPPSEDLWNSHTPYEKRYHMFDDHISITKPSALVIKPPPPPAAAAAFSASKSLDIGDDLSALNINGVVGPGSHKALKEKDGSFLAPNQLSFQIGRTQTQDQMCMSACNDQPKNFEFKAQVPEMSIPNVNVKITAANSFDHHNPAEDSPCWKGAPTSQFLPFEAESPQPPMKKLQTGNGVDLQTDCSFKNSSGADERTSAPVKELALEAEAEAVDAGFGSSVDSNGGVHNDTTKPNKEHADANSQTPRTKLPIPTETDGMKIQPYGKNVSLSGVVKSLYDLSDLLLLHCTSDEFSLKEHDVESLDHVIRNLGVCIGQVQNSSKQGKARCDSFGKNVVEHASLRVEADADPGMVQAIKKVLDENLECKVELPSETLLYKDLWLEAEAELCSLSFRARFQRLKKIETETEMTTHRSKDAAAIKKEKICEDPNPIDDVEAGVMARFNILKRRPEPNPQLDNVPQTTVVAKDVDPWVMERLNILKRRGELNAEEKEVRDCGKEGPTGGHFQDEEEEEEEAVGSGGSDWEHILKDEFSWRLT